MKKILIINGNPNPGSFSEALAKRYFEASKSAGAEVKLYHLHRLEFDPNLTAKNKYGENPEPDLAQIRKDIQWAKHLVFVYPNWWGTYPALFKAFIDRVFIKGFAYEYPDNQRFQTPLLTGKTARLIVTMDTPIWYYRWIYKQPGHNAMKKGTLEFCGIKPVKITNLSPIRNTSLEQRKKYLQRVAGLGKEMI